MEWPPNNRPPCGGWLPTEALATTLGDLNQHYADAESAIPVMKNVTLVPNRDCVDTSGGGCVAAPCPSGTPNYVPPAPLGACTNDPRPCPCGDGGWPTQQWSPITEVPGAVAQALNYYALGDPVQFTNFATCRKRGFKSVYAMKNWHGALPWNAPERCSPIASFQVSCVAVDGAPQLDGAQVTCITPAIAPTPSGQKYLTLTAEADFTTQSGFYAPNADSAQVNSTITVDPLSGRQTGSATQTASGTSSPSDDVTGAWSLLGISALFGTGLPNPLLAKFEAAFTAMINNSLIIGSAYSIPPGSVVITGSGVAWSVTALDASGNTKGTVSVDLNAGTYSSCQYLGESPSTETLSVSETSVVYFYSQDQAPYFASVVQNASLTLSAPYTSDDVNADVDSLLDSWNLCDDIQYPWRADANTTSGPLVTYNERPSTQPGFAAAAAVVDSDGSPLASFLYDDSPGRDSSITQPASPTYPARFPTMGSDYTGPYPPFPEGCVIGAPLPRNNSEQFPNGVCYDPYFDFFFTNYEQNEDGSFVPDSYGAAAPNYGNPQGPMATQWTDIFWANNVPSGPFAAYNSLTDVTAGTGGLYKTGALIVCKWAEAIMFEKPTHNFDRPCGNDILQLDPDSLNCSIIVTATSPYFVLTIAGGLTSDLIYSCGNSGQGLPDGWYPVTATAGTSITLGPIRTDLPLVTFAQGCGDNGFIASSLYPNAQPCPGDYWDDHWRKGEFVFKAWTYDFRAFWESVRMAAAALAVSTGCPAIPYTPVNWVPTGDPVNFIGTGTYWLSGMTASQLCIPHTPCCPNVALVTHGPSGAGPDADTGCSNSVTAGQIPALALDDQYGSLWIGRLEQWMIDPLWAAPGNDGLYAYCSSGCTGIHTDGGSCQPNGSPPGACYTPFPPMEEALTGPPATPPGAPTIPALPAGVEIGCPDFIARQNENPPAASNPTCWPQYTITLNAGYNGSTGNPEALWVTPWVIETNEEQCVQSGLPFAPDYVANGVQLRVFEL